MYLLNYLIKKQKKTKKKQKKNKKILTSPSRHLIRLACPKSGKRRRGRIE